MNARLQYGFTDRIAGFFSAFPPFAELEPARVVRADRGPAPVHQPARAHACRRIGFRRRPYRDPDQGRSEDPGRRCRGRHRRARRRRRGVHHLGGRPRRPGRSPVRSGPVSVRAGRCSALPAREVEPDQRPFGSCPAGHGRGPSGRWEGRASDDGAGTDSARRRHAIHSAFATGNLEERRWLSYRKMRA